MAHCPKCRSDLHAWDSGCTSEFRTPKLSHVFTMLTSLYPIVTLFIYFYCNHLSNVWISEHWVNFGHKPTKITGSWARGPSSDTEMLYGATGSSNACLELSTHKDIFQWRRVLGKHHPLHEAPPILLKQLKKPIYAEAPKQAAKVQHQQRHWNVSCLGRAFLLLSMCKHCPSGGRGIG